MTEKKTKQSVKNTPKKTTKKQQKQAILTVKKATKKVKKLTRGQRIVLVVLVLVLIAALIFAGIYFRKEIADWFQPQTGETPPDENGDDVGNGEAGEDGRYSVEGFQNTEYFGATPLLADMKVNLYFVNVGQGSSLFIIFDDGTTFLADAGCTAIKGFVDKKAAETNLLSLLQKLQITDIDYLFATHPDADHVNLLAVVYDNYQVNTSIYNDIPADGSTSTYNAFRQKALDEPNSKQMTIGATEFNEDYDNDGSKTTETIAGGETNITMYAPGYNNTAAGFKSYKNDKNSMSPICILKYRERKVLFTGDSTVTTENWFLNYVKAKPAKDFDVDVLFVGHHGSNTSSSDAFLNFIAPEYAVISSGAGNSYKHPTIETMQKLKARGIVTYRTDTHGTLELRLDSTSEFGFLPTTRAYTFTNTAGVSDRMLAA